MYAGMYMCVCVCTSYIPLSFDFVQNDDDNEWFKLCICNE